MTTLTACSVEYCKSPNLFAHLNNFQGLSRAPGGLAAFLEFDPPSRLVPTPPFCLTAPLHAHSCCAHVTVWSLSAGDFSHVMALYLKEQDISGLSANESFKEGCSRTTGYGCVQGV